MHKFRCSFNYEATQRGDEELQHAGNHQEAKGDSSEKGRKGKREKTSRKTNITIHMTLKQLKAELLKEFDEFAKDTSLTTTKHDIYYKHE